MYVDVESCYSRELEELRRNNMKSSSFVGKGIASMKFVLHPGSNKGPIVIHIDSVTFKYEKNTNGEILRYADLNPKSIILDGEILANYEMFEDPTKKKIGKIIQTIIPSFIRELIANKKDLIVKIDTPIPWIDMMPDSTLRLLLREAFETIMKMD